MHKPKLALTGLLFASVASSYGAATNEWETSAAAGLTLTRGNSDTLLMTIGVNTARKWPHDEILAGAAGTYGESEINGVDSTTAQSASAYGQYNHLFDDRLYAGLRLDFLHDKIADLSYRFTISPLVGYYVIKEENTRLSFEAGPSGVIERQGGEDDQYLALRFAERFEHKFSDRAKVWQSLEYIPQIDRWSNYLIIGEVGAEAALTAHMSLRGTLQNIYDNEPAPGRKKNDLKLITSLVYKF